MAKTAAERLMERETRVAYGPVPAGLRGQSLESTSWQINGDEFLLRGSGEHYFFYKRGQGITVHRGLDADLSEKSLWLNGSVYAAIASINGLLPIHASAVALDGSVLAFTGQAGAGKSTLVAALGKHGFPMFCDDTLVIDVTDPDRLMCLPGHKRLKLAPDAIEMTGAIRAEKVSTDVDKYYSQSEAGEIRVPLPLKELIFLEEGPNPAISPIVGFEQFKRMNDDHYTAHLYAGAHEFDGPARFEHVSELAKRVPMACFVRPLKRERFAEGVEFLAGYLAHPQDR